MGNNVDGVGKELEIKLCWITSLILILCALVPGAGLKPRPDK